MSTDQAFDKFVPINVTGVVDGWRVIFVDPNEGTVQDVRPMAGWATWQGSVVDSSGKTLKKAEDAFVEALVIHEGWPVCALELAQYGLSVWDYLLPGQDAPKVGELAGGADPGLKGKGDKPFQRKGGPGRGRPTRS